MLCTRARMVLTVRQLANKLSRLSHQAKRTKFAITYCIDSRCGKLVFRHRSRRSLRRYCSRENILRDTRAPQSFINNTVNTCADGFRNVPACTNGDCLLYLIRLRRISENLTRRYIIFSDVYLERRKLKTNCYSFLRLRNV